MQIVQLNSRLRERLAITPEELSEFCLRWQVAELALFGSVLRDDFYVDSDIDVLVSYQPTATAISNSNFDKRGLHPRG